LKTTGLNCANNLSCRHLTTLPTY